MELLKNHYEKIILSVVLLGLAVVAAYLPIEVANVRQSLSEATGGILRPRVQPLQPLDLSTNLALLARLRNPEPPRFARPGHQVFNPARWIKGPDGNPIPEEDLGISQLQVVDITPLYDRVIYQGVRDSGQTIRYQIKEVREASEKRSEQSGVARFMAPGDETDFFRLVKVNGDPRNPESLVIELLENNRQVTITADQPFKQVAGYSADLRHATTKRNYPRRRVGDHLNLGGELYKIVAIEADAVTLENVHTLKRMTIQRNAAR